MGGACGTNGGEEERVYVGEKARGKEATRKTIPKTGCLPARVR
jgi:hypothetical protein